MTPAESLLWSRLRRSALNGFHFRRQQVIRGFIADFYCHEAALIVELDGDVHSARVDYDDERDRILSANGFLTLRFKNQQTSVEIGEVLQNIASACAERTRKVGD